MDVYQDDTITQEDPKPKPTTTLSTEHRAKLDSIVQKMITNKESDDDIHMVIDDFKQKYGQSSERQLSPEVQKMMGAVANIKPAQTPSEPASFEIKQPSYQINLSQPTLRAIPQTKESTLTPSVNEPINIEKQKDQYIPDERSMVMQKKQGEARVRQEKLNTELQSNDALYEKKIREYRRDNYTLENLKNDFKQKGQILSPQDEQSFLQKEKQRQYDRPITPEDITDFKTGTIITPKLSRKFIKDLNNPEIAEHAYKVDKYNEVASDTDPLNYMRFEKIDENAKNIKKGFLTYDPETKQLVHPLGIIGSAIEGTMDKLKMDDKYNFYKNSSDQSIIDELEDERNKPDTDEPIRVPKGKVAEFFNEMAKMPVSPLLAGAIGSLAGPQSGTAAATAVGAYENRKAQFASTLPQVYNELRNQGVEKGEAFRKAKQQAENAQEIGTLVGAGQGLIGAEIGKIPFGGAYNKAIGNTLKQNGTSWGKLFAEGAGQGAIGATGEALKNALAKQAGINRPIDEGTLENFIYNAGMAVGIGGAIKAGKGLSKIDYRNIMHGLSKQPEEAITNTLQEKVQNGEITQKAADETQQRINEYKGLDLLIPDNVSDDARFKIQDKIKKRQEYEAQLETQDKAYHPEIKENVNLTKEGKGKPIKPESGLTKDQEKEATEIAEEWLHEGIIPNSYEGVIKKDPIGFWKLLSQQAHNMDENWRPNEGPSPEQGMREDLGDTVVDYAKELFPIPEIKETPKSVSVIRPGEIQRPEVTTITSSEAGAGKVPAGQIGHVEVSEHGEDTNTAEGKENGTKDTKLTKEKGIPEAEELGQYLIDNNKKKVITSEVARAQETANIAAQKAGIPVETNPVLNTWNIGKYDGKPEGSFVEEAWVNKPNEAPEGGESFNDFTKRMEQAYQFVKSLPEDNHVVSHSKVMRALEALKNTDGKWTDETTKEFLTNKELPNAVPIRSAEALHVGQTSGDSAEMGPRVPESGETTNAQGQQGASQEGEGASKEKVAVLGGGGNLIGISHDALNELAQRLGLPKIERGQVRTPEEYAQMGRELLKQGIDPNTVLNSDLEPHEKAGVARAYLEEMVKNADAIEDKNSTQYKQALQNIAEFKANVVKKLGTQFAELGRALQGKRDLETDSFTAVSTKITDDTGKPLTSEQTQKVKELTEKNKALQSKVDDLEAKLTKATDEDLGKETSKGTKTKKSHEQYVKERKDAFDAARKALKNLRSGSSGLGVSIPLVRELGAITPHTFKIVKSLLEEGVNKLGDIVDAIHDEFSKDIIGLRRRDVIDLISGKYAATKDIKPNELTEIRKQSKLVAKLEDLQNGVPENFDKNKTEQSAEVKKLLEQIKKVKKDLADMGYMVSKKNEPLSPEEKNIKRLEKELEDLKQGIAKQKSPSRDLTDKEIELKEQIKDEREKLGLVSSKEKKPLAEHELQEQHENNVKNLQEQFINKKGNKFTYDEAKSIWGYMKETYLDKGVKFRDAISQVSNDIGLSFEQISNAITTPKTKRISDAMWKKRYDLQKNRMATQRYVDAQNQNPAIRLFKKITGARRGESIFGHAGVFVGTHAGMTLFDLPRTKYTIKAFLNAYKFGYGKIANYEKSMEGLKKRPNYELAQRSGLKNNPDIIDNDAEITKPFLSKYLGKFMESGKRGYNAMKILRQDLFDAHYNALSEAEKADPGSAISIAKEINNATGATNLDLAIRNKQGDIVFDPNEVFFAPGMEAARWAKLTRNPAKATSVALQALFKPESVSIKDKVFAKVWAKRVGTQLATFSALLTANAAMQSMFTDDKNKKVNLFDPTKSDWLKFKFGNTTFENTSGMLSTLHFIQQMAYQSAFDESSKYHETEEKSIGRTVLKYGVGKLAPFYGDVAEVILRHDYNGNTMPWSDAKPLHGYNHKLTWEEYAESKLPLPVAEGFKAFYESAQENGMSKSQIGDILNGLQYGFISGTTGFKAYETKSSNGGSGGGAGAGGSYEKPTRTRPEKPHKIHK